MCVRLSLLLSEYILRSYSKQLSCAVEILIWSDAVDFLTKSLGMPYSVVTAWEGSSNEMVNNGLSSNEMVNNGLSSNEMVNNGLSSNEMVNNGLSSNEMVNNGLSSNEMVNNGLSSN